MNCPLQSEDTLDLLLDFSAGRLDSARSSLLERHMDSCARCAAFRAEQTELWNALDAWEPEPVGSRFNRRLWQRIDAIALEPWYRRFLDGFRFRAWKPAFPLAAAACIITAGFLLDHANTPASKGVAGASGVSVAEVDQVEKALDDIQLLRRLDSASHADTN
jgi:anti-sigma factor RsiW